MHGSLSLKSLYFLLPQLFILPARLCERGIKVLSLFFIDLVSPHMGWISA